MEMDQIVKSMIRKSYEKGWSLSDSPIQINDDGKKTVHILGLFWMEFGFRKIKSRDDFSGDVWTMNDFYLALRWLKQVDRVFQIHPYDVMMKIIADKKSKRCTGDMSHNLNRLSKEIMVTDPKFKEYFQRDILMLDYKYLHEKYETLEFGQTLDYMILQAVEEGYERICLSGVYLQNDDHIKFCRSLIKTIDHVRGLGIEVQFDWYDEIAKIKNDKTERYLDIFYK